MATVNKTRSMREEGKKGEKRRMWKGWYINQKDFFSMNLSNSKGESFDAKGIGYGGEERSTTAGLKEKLAGGFSRGITLSFFNSSNQARVLVHSFC